MQYTAAGKRPHSLDNGDTPKRKKRKQNDDDDEVAATTTAKKLKRSHKDDFDITPKVSSVKATDSTAKAPKPAKKSKTTQPEPIAIPKIMPGERMSDFAARVDQALPISGLTRKSRKIDGMKERQTRLEKKIQRRIAEWRGDEEKLKQVEEDERDLADLEDAEAGGEGVLGYEDEEEGGAKKRKGKGRKGGGSKADQEEGDIWKKLRDTREKPKGLFDVAQAPPTFTKVPREVFKVRNGAKVSVGSVPKTAGSLKRREELEAARKETIERYRKMMEQKKI
jgi:hypothetical protein